MPPGMEAKLNACLQTAERLEQSDGHSDQEFKELAKNQKELIEMWQSFIQEQQER